MPDRSVPSVGRDVHYVSRGSADGVYPAVCRAAKITEVGPDGRVGLAILNPDGLHFHPLTKNGGVAYDDRDDPPGGLPQGWVQLDGPPPGAPGTWHWPERAEG